MRSATIIDKLQIVAEAPAWCASRPRRSRAARPTTSSRWFGELHPAWATDIDLTGPVVAFELDLDAIPEPRKKATQGQSAPSSSPT